MRPSLALLAVVLLAGCGSAPVRPPAVTPAPVAAGQVGERAAALAASLVGSPYRYGGATRDGFDCSGLVYYVYTSLGIPVPRTAAAQRAAVTRVRAEELEPGDLVFFYTPEDHVGIYLGNGEFVHAPARGRTVERTRLDSPFFLLGYAGSGRFAGSVTQRTPGAAAVN